MDSLLTPHFRIHGKRVDPIIAPHEIDNGIVDMLMRELHPLGLVPDQEAFERLFVETVLSGAPEPTQAWSAFYANSLKAFREPGVDGSTVIFARIYRRAIRLAGAGSLLDVGCAFGFFPLLRAGSGAPTLGCDLNPSTVDLAAAEARRLKSPARFMAGDGRSLPVANDAFDTVTVLHLLEHLGTDGAHQVVAEAMRVARRRVLIAVPLEQAPQPAFGHVQVFSIDSLRQVTSAAKGWAVEVNEADGGWVLLDRSD